MGAGAALNTVPPAGAVEASAGVSAPRVYLFGSYLAGASAGVDEAMGLGAWPIDGPGLADAGAFFAAGLAGGVVFAMRMSPELFASRSRRLIHDAKSTGAPAERGGSSLKGVVRGSGFADRGGGIAGRRRARTRRGGLQRFILLFELPEQPRIYLHRGCGGLGPHGLSLWTVCEFKIAVCLFTARAHIANNGTFVT